LQRQWEVAIMISPPAVPDQAGALGRFAAAVEVVIQLDKSFKARS
jgi:hypothetical protein